MENIDLDTGLVTFGVNETMKCLFDLAVETLIVYEDLDMQIVDLIPTDPKNGKEVVKKYLPLKDLEYKSTYVDKKDNIEYNIQDYDSLVDFLGEQYKDYKCKIFYVSDLSAEGH
jgi:peptide chain release factor subunit 1